MYPLLRPLLFTLDAETAHQAVMAALRTASTVPGIGQALAAAYAPPPLPRLVTKVFGLEFPHPICLAAGLDKDGVAVSALESLGFGAVEVGTVTPRPQAGNPKPRLFRLPLDHALINRMGFNNQGAEELLEQLSSARRPHPRPLGINLGKNKDTVLEEAPRDYLASYRVLYEVGDYFVVNVSSPNTPGLRSLQTVAALEPLVTPLLEERAHQSRRKPLLIKLAPDLADEDAVALAQAAQKWGVDGFILSNTTLAREGLVSPAPLIGEAGGLSGAPLKARSTALIKLVTQAVKLPVIGVGGIATPEDALEKLRAGASLVQVYTSFVYQGPALPGVLARGLDALLARDKVESLSQLRLTTA